MNLPNFGPEAARAINIARSLRMGGHVVTFISWSGDYRAQDLRDDGIYYYDNFPYIITHEVEKRGASFKKRVLSKLSRGAKTKKILKEWNKPIDVIISYCNAMTGWLIRYCRRNGIHLVNDLTEWHSFAELSLTDKVINLYKMYYLNHLIHNKIVISSYLERFYSSSHNIIVPATCDGRESKWHVFDSNIRDLVGDFSGITLIYAGTPTGKDAIKYAINAVNRLCLEGESIRLLILGCTRENYLNKNKNRFLTDNICFLGRVSQDLIPSFYALSDFMILPREITRKSQAGFATKFAESITSGTPVIANLTSDMGLYLKDGITGFVFKEPTEESIYKTLKLRVLPLTRDEISNLKDNVRKISHKLDFRNYVEPLRKFMNQLG